MGLTRLLSPLQLRKHTLRNRVVFGAHTTNMAVQGLPTEQHIAYYRERAVGGAAMVVVEPMPVHAAAVLTRGNFRHSSDEVISHFQPLTRAIKDHGAVAIQQLYHIGAHGDADNSYHAHWSPSGLPSYHDSDGSHAMTEAEIEQTIDGFVQAARRCQQAGFDGVEVWAAYHGLVDQFWTPWSNHRQDPWGGSLQNRTRFSRTILTQIRQLCGEDFIVGLAVSDEPDFDVMLSRQELAEIVALHDQEGLIDYVTCGVGGYLDFYKLMPTFLYPEKMGADLAAVLKPRVRHAKIIAEAHIRTPENAETILGEGSSDLVSIVRGQIADPHLARKAQEDRAEDIRGCLSCNQMCWGRRSRDYWISCLVNPSVGREWQWGGEPFAKCKKTKKVLVVGAGPAGLEAARVAAERGHQVTLAEANAQVGGAFRLAGRQPRRGQILDLLDWYERQLAQLGVDLRLNTYLQADEIVAHQADKIIVATGSLPVETGFQKALPQFARLPGIEYGQVFSAEDAMARQARLGESVIVFDEGGNWKGCGTAWQLAQDGHRVTIVTPDPMVGKELQRTAADFPLRQRLAKLGVKFVCESGILAWTPEGARTRSFLSGEESFVAANSLVFATANRSFDELAQALREQGIAHECIGDALAPRQAPYAFYEGRKIGLEL